MLGGWNGFRGRASLGFIPSLAATVFLFLGAVCPAQVVAGETVWLTSWYPGSGGDWPDWFDPANWSAGVPGPDDSAVISTSCNLMIDGSTALSSLSMYGALPTAYQLSGDVTISGALTLSRGGGVGANYSVFSGASLWAGEIRLDNPGYFFTMHAGSSVHAGVLQVGPDDCRDVFYPEWVDHADRTPNPNLAGWLVGGDGEGGDGRITFNFGRLPGIGPIVFENGRTYSMKDVAAAINAASQASLRYNAARIIYDSDSNEYSLRVEARKRGMNAWDCYGEDAPTQQGMEARNWTERSGVAGNPGSGGYLEVSGDLDVDRLEVRGGSIESRGVPGTITVTGELHIACASALNGNGAIDFRMIGADVKNEAVGPGYCENVIIRFLPSDKTARVEADAIDVGADYTGWDPQFSDSMIFEALFVGSAIELVDDYGNQLHADPEALYVDNLIMEPGGFIGGGLNLYYRNGGEAKQFFHGDANLDGKVGIADLAVLADNYGRPSGADWAHGDFNGDGVIGIADLSTIADNYGAATQPVAHAAGVPEPSALGVLAGGWMALTLARRHRRRRG